MTLCRNSVDSINLKNSLDLMSHGDSFNKLREVESLLLLNGELSIDGVDLEELCRARYNGYITSKEFYEVYDNCGQIMSIHDRIEQLESLGFTITVKRLANLRYHIKATRK